MRWAVSLVVVSAVLAAAPAEAAAPTLSGLQHQVTALRTQLVTVKAEQAALAARVTGVSDLATCQTALQQDNINGMWHTLVLLAVYDGFPAQPDLPRYDDKGACGRIGVTR